MAVFSADFAVFRASAIISLWRAEVPVSRMMADGVHMTDVSQARSGGRGDGNVVFIRVRTIFMAPPQQAQAIVGLGLGAFVAQVGASFSR